MLRRSGRCLFLATFALLIVAPAAGATFWGDNGRISFNRFLDDQEARNIFSVRPNGTGLTNLTPFGFGVFSIFSDWSPDGEQLAIDTDRSGQAQVWILDADGSDARQLTDAANGGLDPGWAPDGRTLAIDSEPQVSPDGRWIAFTRYTACTDDGCTTQIFRVRTNGTALQPLTRPELNASAPDWHPTGQVIAFDTHDNFVAPNAGSIIVMRPDGSGKRTLLRGDADDYFNNPSFSPDGRQMTFARWPANEEDPAGQIWVASAAGRGTRQLLDSPMDENKPDWGSAPKRGHHGH